MNMNKNLSISVNKDYMMMIYNPVLNKLDYSYYHVIDICCLNNEFIVNIQYRNSDDQLCRTFMSKDAFDNLVDLQYLTLVT